MYFKQHFSPNVWSILVLASLIAAVISGACKSNEMYFGDGTVAGYYCNSAGDVDGDTYPDIICGDERTGNAYLIFGRSAAFPNPFSLLTATPSDGVIKITVSATNAFGYYVNGVGDINGDSFDDFAISDIGGRVVYIYFGKPRASWTLNPNVASFLTGTDGFKIYSPTAYYLGYEIKMGGDFNKDGKKDLLVIAADPDKQVIIIWGRSTTWTDINVNTMLSSVGIKILRSANQCMFYSVDYAGDINADGTDDIIVGCVAPKTFVIFGKAGLNSNIDVDTLSIPTDGIVLTKTGGNLGRSVCRLGDVNADGVDDFILSNRQPISHIVFGKAGITDIDLSTLGSGSGIQLTGTNVGLGCGYAGDLNGDGYNDAFFSPNSGDFLALIWGGPHLTTIGTIDVSSASTTIVMRAQGSFLADGLITFPLDVDKVGPKEIYHGSSLGHLYQFTPCCTVSQYLTGTGYDSCAECSTLNPDCTACTNANTCTSCSGGKHPVGATCISCTATQYWTGSGCTDCSTLNADCTACTGANICTACSGGKIPQGNKCVDSVSVPVPISEAESEDDTCCLPGFTFCLSAWTYTGIGLGAGFGVMTILYFTLRRSCINRKRRMQIRPESIETEVKPLSESHENLRMEEKAAFCSDCCAAFIHTVLSK